MIECCQTAYIRFKCLLNTCFTLTWSVNKKIPLTRGIVKKTDCSAKISEIKIKIPSASVLATNFALNAVENKLVI